MAGMAAGVAMDAIDARLAAMNAVFEGKPGRMDVHAAGVNTQTAHNMLVAAAQGDDDGAAHESEPLRAAPHGAGSGRVR
jgi:hypothetical protein